jgi:hypothetical protein
MGLMQLIVLIMYGLTGLADEAGDNATPDITTINTPPKLRALRVSGTRRRVFW